MEYETIALEVLDEGRNNEEEEANTCCFAGLAVIW
jgi:putative radical SAM-modified peptide